jgi:putative (di)nucleoside polyphosphate hydrolase
VSLIKKIDGILTYHLPNELLGIIWKGKFKGQKQQWYVMRFDGDEKEINIKTKHPEFLEWKWVDPDEITKLVVKFKLHVYEKIQEEVKKILIN